MRKHDTVVHITVPVDLINLLLLPGVQVHTSHEGNVHAKVSVDAAAIDAHEDSEVDAGPAGAALAAVSAVQVLRCLEHSL